MLKNLRESISKLEEEHELINAHLEEYYDESAENNYLDFFTRIISKVADGEKSSIFINDRENESVWHEVVTGTGQKHIHESKDDTMVNKVIATGKAEINNDMVDQKEAHTARNAICVPVKSLDGKRVTGVIQVLNKGNGGSFNEDDQNWLEDIAQNIQFNIEHISLHQGSLSITDKVFGVFSKLWTLLTILFLVSVAGFTLFLLALWLAT
jgi:GAF domain-containing protein